MASLKTIEATALQVGKSSLYVNIIVSTLHEAEYLLPYLLECKEGGKAVNVGLCQRMQDLV